MKRFLVYFSATILLLIPCYIYYRYNPDNPNWLAKCSFHEYTSYNCPGCGGQRAIHYLLHGEILQALHHNLIFTLGLPFLLYLYFLVVDVYILKDKKLLRSFMYSPKFGFSVVAVIILFLVLRNIPFFPFTYLAPPV